MKKDFSSPKNFSCFLSVEHLKKSKQPFSTINNFLWNGEVPIKIFFNSILVYIKMFALVWIVYHLKMSFVVAATGSLLLGICLHHRTNAPM